MHSLEDSLLLEHQVFIDQSFDTGCRGNFSHDFLQELSEFSALTTHMLGISLPFSENRLCILHLRTVFISLIVRFPLSLFLYSWILSILIPFLSPLPFSFL